MTPWNDSLGRTGFPFFFSLSAKLHFLIRSVANEFVITSNVEMFGDESVVDVVSSFVGFFNRLKKIDWLSFGLWFCTDSLWKWTEVRSCSTGTGINIKVTLDLTKRTLLSPTGHRLTGSDSCWSIHQATTSLAIFAVWADVPRHSVYSSGSFINRMLHHISIRPIHAPVFVSSKVFLVSLLLFITFFVWHVIHVVVSRGCCWWCNHQNQEAT